MRALEITDAPTPDMRTGIALTLEAYNTSMMAEPGGFRLLVIPVRDDDGKTIGGLWGSTWARWMYVELLVVPEGMRKTGLGTKLLTMAEDEAKQRGCVGAWLTTLAFQARPFYEKLGYSAFTTWTEFMPGTDFHFMRKLFA